LHTSYENTTLPAESLDEDDRSGCKVDLGSAGGSYKCDSSWVIIPDGALDANVDCVLVIKESDSGNFTLGDQVYDIKLYCNGVRVTQLKKTAQVCIKPKDGITSGKQIFRQPDGGQWGALPESKGPAGYNCGDTPGFSLFGLGELQLPDTGFALGVVTVPEAQPAEKRYAEMSDFTLEIPDIDLKMTIVGVPLTGEGWDVSWLGDAAGYLEGTAFPTWAGNTALTAHVWNADNTPGPLVDLHTLGYGDRVQIHAWGQVYTYEVRDVMQVKPDDLRALPHDDYDVLTLITCQGFDQTSGEYDWRLAVRAVLIQVK